MSLKRALVVDDSKVARVTLQKQLQEYDLQVELAESGEAAIELLKTRMVDVIFMDHIMPGMDGLEAVALIKSNPLTATIPVMMYTSKEGEVYVSEARALGAVGVLPKQVQPGVLFGMLTRLGLVRDRRRVAREDAESEPGANGAQRDADDDDDDDESKPVGMELSSLVSRILEDQHGELRSEIRSSYRQFARQVADDIHDQLREQHELEKLDEALDRQRKSGWLILSSLLGLAALLLLVLFLQARTDRVAVQQELARVSGELERARQSSASANQTAALYDGERLTQAERAYREMIDAIVRGMNESGAIPYDERPFNDVRVDEITDLLWRLSEAAFQGTVRIESHLGAYCLVSDAAGVYEVQEPDAPFTSCSFIGHPLDDSRLLSDRQTASFELFLAASPLLAGSGIDLDIVINDRTDSYARVPYPSNPATAGEWNRVAALNNRLEYSVVRAAAGR